MKKIPVVFWSGGGNTEEMAIVISEEIKNAGAESELIRVSDAKVDEVAKAEVIVLGCSAMGAEQLEESEFEPFFTELEEQLNGKRILLFGSYGWGSGEYMKIWEERVITAGGLLLEESILAQSAPNPEVIEKCKEVGKMLALYK